jgi:transposase
LQHVEGLSQREIHRRTGIHRDTIRWALAAPKPPSYGPRPKRGSKLDPFVAMIEELLQDEPRLSGVGVREEIEEAGYDGSKTILDDLLRELRPRFLPPPRSFQRTRYRPGELCQFDLCEPRCEIPVGYGQSRRGYFVTWTSRISSTAGASASTPASTARLGRSSLSAFQRSATGCGICPRSCRTQTVAS